MNTTVIKTNSAAAVKSIHGAGLSIKLIDKCTDGAWVYSVKASERQVQGLDLTVLESMDIALASATVQGLADGVYTAQWSGSEVEIAGQVLTTPYGIRGSVTTYAIVANGRVQGFRG